MTCLKKLRTFQIFFIVVLIIFLDNDVSNSPGKKLIKRKGFFTNTHMVREILISIPWSEPLAKKYL